jgi:hypothetical protein
MKIEQAVPEDIILGKAMFLPSDIAHDDKLHCSAVLRPPTDMSIQNPYKDNKHTLCGPKVLRHLATV